jgi:hypothetical protein
MLHFRLLTLGASTGLVILPRFRRNFSRLVRMSESAGVIHLDVYVRDRLKQF